MSWIAVVGKGVWSLVKGTANVGKNALTGVGNALLHPVSSTKNVAKAALLGTTAAVATKSGWDSIVNDKPYSEALTDNVVGEKGREKIDKAVETVSDIKESTTSAISEMTSSVSSINSSLGGIKNFISNLFNGNGLGSISNFFDNIGKGNVSGMSLLGLLAAGFLVFGRFGWLGKIAGALMSMMIIGNNSSRTQQQTQQQTQQRTAETPERETSTGMRR